MKRFPALCAIFLVLLTGSSRAQDYNPTYVELQDAPTISVDWSKGGIQHVRLGGNRAITFSNGQLGRHYLLIVSQDRVGSRTITWPPSVRWPGGTPPTLTTIAGKTDYITAFFTGHSYDIVGFAQNY